MTTASSKGSHYLESSNQGPLPANEAMFFTESIQCHLINFCRLDITLHHPGPARKQNTRLSDGIYRKALKAENAFDALAVSCVA